MKDVFIDLSGCAKEFYLESLAIHQTANILKAQVMFVTGNLLFFQPFIFKNGVKPQDK